MKIATVFVRDYSNPVEVQTWLDANPSATIIGFTVYDKEVFYILYQ